MYLVLHIMTILTLKVYLTCNRRIGNIQIKYKGVYMAMKKEHLVVVGFDEIVSNKYISCIGKAIDEGVLDGYSIIELKSQKEEIDARVIKVEPQPEMIYYIETPVNPEKNGWAVEKDFAPVIEKIRKIKGKIKVYIATELKAHEGYLEYCVRNGIPSLVEKPIFSPMINGKFVANLIQKKMRRLLKEIEENPSSHSVMTLGRYHQIYNDIGIEFIKERMLKSCAPLTSLHLRHAGGVWNLHKEYEEREDHPYKYGYGMLMHGGYHYIDIFTQFLSLNRLIYPEMKFEFNIASYAAFPADQNKRISSKISQMFDDDREDWAVIDDNDKKYGETDITSTFCLKDKETGRIITLGTISLEQTTPSVRAWKDFPEGVYNKNGRTSFVEVEAQISTLHSLNIMCYDVPVKNKKEIERIDAFARVLTRSNGTLLRDEEYITENTYGGLFHSNSNKTLMMNWLLNKEDKSRFEQHVPVMSIIQAIGESIQNIGKTIKCDIF